MTSGSWKVAAGVHVDIRRAVYLEGAGVLAITDLHLGYAWVQRQRGALLPIGEDDTLERTLTLIRDWRPRRLVILGDLVHAVAGAEGVRGAVREFLQGLPSGIAVDVILGNHDVRLAERLVEWGVGLPCHAEWGLEGMGFVHGHVPPTMELARTVDGSGGWILSGHEHPALELGDGGTTTVRVPAFLVGSGRIVLPAFSNWAAGCVLGRERLLGEWARGSVFTHAVACVGTRLLPIPWDRVPGGGARMAVR